MHADIQAHTHINKTMHTQTQNAHLHTHGHWYMCIPLLPPGVLSCQPRGLLPPVNLDMSCLGSILVDANVTVSLYRVLENSRKLEQTRAWKLGSNNRWNLG